VHVEAAARYPSSVWMNAGRTAAALWIPPGGTELSPDQGEQLDALLIELLGAEDAPRVARAI
jgi:hypothetical protein